MGCGAETKDLILEDQICCIRGCEEFKYLGVKIDKEDRQENYIKNRINRRKVVTGMLEWCAVEETNNQKKQITNTCI